MSKKMIVVLMVLFTVVVTLTMTVVGLAVGGIVVGGYIRQHNQVLPLDEQGQGEQELEEVAGQVEKQIEGTAATATSPEMEELRQWLAQQYQEVLAKHKAKGMDSLNLWERVLWGVAGTDYALTHPQEMEDFGANPGKVYVQYGWMPDYAQKVKMPLTQKLFRLDWEAFKKTQPRVLPEIIKELRNAQPQSPPKGVTGDATIG